MSSLISDRKALEAFVVDNPDLERLEALLDQFNFFEAIGAVRQELRHSDFLAFLLNPRGTHRLGDYAVTRLLQRVVSRLSPDVSPISSIDLDVWNLDELVVLREWENIDILLVDEVHKLVVLIENKIDTNEHSNQLTRYWETVTRHYPDWRKLGLFLTPDGATPSVEVFLPVDYGVVAGVLEDLTRSRASALDNDIVLAIRHYAQMLRRHIVADSEIVDLCQRLYHKHQRALDLIFEHRPDRQSAISEWLANMVREASNLTLLSRSKSVVRFAPTQWDEVPPFMKGTGWPPTHHLIAFEFTNSPTSLRLKLTIGPGPQPLRQQLFDLALVQQPPFKPSSRTLYPLWSTIYTHAFLGATAYDSPDTDVLAAIRQRWEHFLGTDLPTINHALASLDLSAQVIDS